jgi:hypothetical protein
MDRVGFRAYLLTREANEEAIARSFELAERFEAYCQSEAGCCAAEATADLADAFSATLIETGDNAHDDFRALARYTRFLRNHDAYLVMHGTIDGDEAFGNLHRKVAVELGEPLRDALFAGIEMPVLGVSNLERARRMRVVVERLEKKIGPERAAALIGQGLRNLSGSWYRWAPRSYALAGGIDEFLRRWRERFLKELRKLHEQDLLFVSQPITADVIAYVEAHPEIEPGVRVGNEIRVAKIPYMAKEYLEETDPRRRAYYYCHCPWARESLRRGETKMPGVFCNCSAAFHRKPFEVIFKQKLEYEILESVLSGAERCLFAIRLPKGVA